MFITLAILNGARKGEEFKMQAGATIGRKGADLTIKDAKMSLQHARFDFKEGEMFLVDLGSRNKILAGSKVVEELLLEENTEFILGSTRFRISLAAHENYENPILKDLQSLEKNLANVDRPIYPFSHKLRLKFTSGPQKGKDYPLGYGPRSAGKGSIDIRLSEHFDQDTLFVLEQKDEGFVFHTEYPDHFLVNGKPAKAENKIEDQTEIEFANTKMQFEIEK